MKRLHVLAAVFGCACTIYRPPPEAPNEAYVPAPGTSPPVGVIRVVSATYGANCGAPAGNVTTHVARQCDGRADCDYRVDYTVIGDPAIGCAKTYAVEWRCDSAPDLLRASAPPEAGFGAIVKLSCTGAGAPMPAPPAPPPVAAPTPPPAAAPVGTPALSGSIQVMAGTYGGNCGAPYGNKTAPLAAACDGRIACNYRVDYKVIGDPVVGCGKDFVAEWRCAGTANVFRAAAAPEAGFGSVVTLGCGQP
jgi:hypothetical protein